MQASQIRVGGYYLAKVNGNVVTVRVDSIRDCYSPAGNRRARYDVTNTKTGRRTTFRSAQKFRAPAEDPAEVRRRQFQKERELAERVKQINAERDKITYIDPLYGRVPVEGSEEFLKAASLRAVEGILQDAADGTLDLSPAAVAERQAQIDWEGGMP